MKYKKRTVSDRIMGLAAHFSVVVVTGARQVGKSTLINNVFPDWNCVVFDPVVDVGNARQDPEFFLQNHAMPLILDEIQYCPELVAVIKRRVDMHKQPGMYVLTGSQQWSVLKTIAESLAGRAVFVDLEGFSLCEAAEQIPQKNWLKQYLDSPTEFVNQRHSRLSMQRSVYELLWRGSLPEADTVPPDYLSDYFAGYIRTYVERDIRLLLNADDWQQFGRFVQLVSALTSSEMNYSQLGREIGITPQTARRWLSVLSATFQWYELPAYHGNTIKRISAKPKGYFSDTGIACYLNRISTAQALAGHPLIGALFETAVVAEIRKQLSSLGQKPQLYHWRIHSGSEVDVIMEQDGVLYPMEIKLNSRPKPKDARGLRAFRENYPKHSIAPGLVIAPSETVMRLSENEYVIPWDLR